MDLAGVRVALYFPGEREQVGGIANRLFVEWDASRDFPRGSPPSKVKTFSGYVATLYRVRLRSQDLADSDQRYAAANIEIQVASVLMHAWSEVDHDLVYKPSEGELSEEEYVLLDQLNGLVLAGELGLEQLQKAGEARVAVGTRQFANHYELAAHLLSQASPVKDQPVTDSGLGRVDLLFRLLTRLDLNTPDDLRPYLDLLHGDLEQRPLAEQIIDALVAEDASRYEAYLSIRAEVDVSRAGPTPRANVVFEMGRFVGRWARLESLVRDLLPPTDRRRAGIPTGRVLEKMELLTPQMSFEFDRLRRIRNELVHGILMPSDYHLDDAADRIDELISEIERRRDSQYQAWAGVGNQAARQPCTVDLRGSALSA